MFVYFRIAVRVQFQGNYALRICAQTPENRGGYSGRKRCKPATIQEWAMSSAIWIAREG